MHTENSLSHSKNILINLTEQNKSDADLTYLLTHFCGTTVTHLADTAKPNEKHRVYVVGDLAKLSDSVNDSVELLVIKEFSFNVEQINHTAFKLISHGQVPLNIHNAGVYYRK